MPLSLCGPRWNQCWKRQWDWKGWRWIKELLDINDKNQHACGAIWTSSRRWMAWRMTPSMQHGQTVCQGLWSCPSQQQHGLQLWRIWWSGRSTQFHYHNYELWTWQRRNHGTCTSCRITFLTGRIVFNVKLEQDEIDHDGGRSFNPLMRWVWIWQDLLNEHQIKEEQKQDTSWWPLSRSHG